MKHSDIEKIFQAGLITEAQRRQIVEHFKLKEEGNRFVTILSWVGAVLVVGGIILLIASNWDAIPHGVKIAAGLILMLAAHGGGWYLREVKGFYRKTGEALHLIGSGLFLGNIALIGQIYHLSSRPPNAILLWWLGIAALPWLLRSKTQHVLCLAAFSLWFGLEVNQAGSWIYFGEDERQLVLYALLGLLFLGAGYGLRRTVFNDFAGVTEKLGLLAFLGFTYPLTWGALFRYGASVPPVCPWLFWVLAAAALAAAGAGAATLGGVPRQWRWAWALTLAAGLGLLAGALYLAPHWSWTGTTMRREGYHWCSAVGFFVFCLLQTRAGLELRSEYMINLGVAFIGLNILSTYLNLFGSMANTGLVFVVGGVFLLAFGLYLERKRRTLMQQIKIPLR